MLAKEDGQEASGDRQADTLGLGGSGEPGLLFGVEDDGEGALRPGQLQAGLRLGQLLLQAGDEAPRRRAPQIAKDAAGFAVQALAGAAAALGV
jgi:hypothetical protein